MEISARLMASIGGRLVRPQSHAKVFELHVSTSVSTKSETASRPRVAQVSDREQPLESQNLISLHSAIRWALHLAGAQEETLTAALLEDILHLMERRQRPAAAD
jgi:glycerate-2-kinase